MVAIAAAIVLGGLALAVGAGARGGPSVRDASYPVNYAYKIVITDRPAKSSDDATFAFHAVYAYNGERPPHSVLKYLHYVCKLDKKHAGKCDSPQKYHNLAKGKHKFAVKLVYDKDSGGDQASATKTVKWKVN